MWVVAVGAGAYAQRAVKVLAWGSVVFMTAITELRQRLVERLAPIAALSDVTVPAGPNCRMLGVFHLGKVQGRQHELAFLICARI